MPLISIAAALSEAAQQLNAAGIESATLDASILLAHILKTERAQLIFQTDKQLSDKELFDFKALVARRLTHEPVAYIIGKKEFWSLDFYVTRDTLIPRPDSETLVEAALKRVKKAADVRIDERAMPINILDVGTGTACLLVALLKELPTARGVGVDKYERALQVAYENAKRHGVENRVRFVQSHWCNALDGTFDLIISNPPYIRSDAVLMSDVADFEPSSALFSGADGLDSYRSLAPQMQRLLKPQGVVVFEVGQGQANAVAKLLSDEGLTIEAIEKDLAGTQRCVVASKKGD